MLIASNKGRVAFMTTALLNFGFALNRFDFFFLTYPTSNTLYQNVVQTRGLFLIVFIFGSPSPPPFSPPFGFFQIMFFGLLSIQIVFSMGPSFTQTPSQHLLPSLSCSRASAPAQRHINSRSHSTHVSFPVLLQSFLTGLTKRKNGK